MLDIHRWLCRRLVLSLALAAALALSIGTESAAGPEPAVYLNGAGNPVQSVTSLAIPPNAQDQTFALFVDAGDEAGSSGTPCINGDGQQTCAVQIDLMATGGVSFDPATPFVGETGAGVVFEASGDALSIVWTDSTAEAGPRRLGTIQIDTTAEAGTLELMGGGAVVGQLVWTELSAEDLAEVAVPEPDFAGALVAGGLFLLLLLSSLGPGRSHGPRDRTIERAAAALLLTGGLGLGLLSEGAPARAADPGQQFEARWAEMTAGRAHTCGIRTSGDIFCFGADNAGQVSTAPAGSFKRISASNDTTCAITQLGTDIVCWGDNTGGLLNAPDSVVPFVTLSVGGTVACAVRADWSVDCWGLGVGVFPPIDDFRVTEVSAGTEHACGRQPDARLICWGTGFANNHIVPGPLRLEPFRYVGSGLLHTCALGGDLRVDCWGDPSFNKTAPPAVDFVGLSTREDHACAIRADDGTVECWGRDDSGETTPPVGVVFDSVHVGRDHTCGIKPDRQAECWGDDGSGQSSPPRSVARSIASGPTHTCHLTWDRTLECFGTDTAGQLTPPVLSGVSMVANGREHSCALRGGNISCWGRNDDGQASPPVIVLPQYTRVAAGGDVSCGIRTPFNNKASPIECWGDSKYGVDSPPSGSFVEISVGLRHACAIDTKGEVHCWGDPSSTNGKTNPPLDRFVEIAAGSEHTCGITERGTVRCWGDDAFGQSAYQRKIFTRIAAGEDHTCGLLRSGRLRCWGNALTGVTDPPPGLYESVSAGLGYSCAARVGGGVACWGQVVPASLPAPDADGDGHEDGIDNCPFISNRDQADGDEDGAGDLCDVCPTFPDVDQLASYLDGVGDRCDAPPRVELEPESLSVAPIEASYRLWLDCGVSTISRLETIIVIPRVGGLLPTPKFGDGCVGPSPGCSSATDLGATVDFTTVVGAYFLSSLFHEGSLRLELNGFPGLNLCTPGTRLEMGILRIPGVTSFDVLPRPIPPASNDGGITNSNGLAGRPPQTSYSTLPGVDFKLTGDATGRYTLEMTTPNLMHRVNIGIRRPPFGGAGSIVPVSYGPFVNQAGGLPNQVLPDSGQVAPVRSDTHYFEFVGTAVNPGGNPILNLSSAPETLMVFDYVGAMNLPPILEVDGIAEAFAATDPFETSEGAGFGEELVSYDFFVDDADTDSDGRLDEIDNCPFTENQPGFEDRGGFNSTEENERGDRCECGDANGDGAVFAAPSPSDPNELRDFLANKQTTDPALTNDLCSVAGGVECNALDLLTLELSLLPPPADPGPGPLSVCRGAVGVSLLNAQ